MDVPTCIIDAATFVDHIQDLKNWLYRDQLHIFVENDIIPKVEHLCQKAKDIQVAEAEILKSRPTTKSSKREQPAFDINPRTAKAFLERVKYAKNGDAAPLGRSAYAVEENHHAIEFVTSEQQYSPWRDARATDQVREPPRKDHGSWADELNRQQELAGCKPNQPKFKALPKPKLVVKPSEELSPWKTQRQSYEAVVEVPMVVRSIMSFALWRLHESSSSNHHERFFVMSDDVFVTDICRKLGIPVLATATYEKLHRSEYPKPDLTISGELEREFGSVKQKMHMSNSGSNYKLNGHTPTRVNEGTSDRSTIFSEAITSHAKLAKRSEEIDTLQSKATNAAKYETSALILDPIARVGNTENHHIPEFCRPASSDSSAAGRIKNQVGQIRSEKIIIPSSSVLENHSSEYVGQESKVKSELDQAIQEGVDSEEEVVVFKPKSSSAQRDKTQPTIRANTASSSRAEVQTRPDTAISVKQSQSPAPSPRVEHLKPQTSTPVIDPDAFGRGFAVKPEASGRRGERRGTRANHLQHLESSRGPERGMQSPSRQGSSPRPNRNTERNLARNAHVNMSKSNNMATAARDSKPNLQQHDKVGRNNPNADHQGGRSNDERELQGQKSTTSEQQQNSKKISKSLQLKAPAGQMSSRPASPFVSNAEIDSPKSSQSSNFRDQMVNAPIFGPSASAASSPRMGSTPQPPAPSTPRIQQAPIGSGRPHSQNVMRQSEPDSPSSVLGSTTPVRSSTSNSRSGSITASNVIIQKPISDLANDSDDVDSLSTRNLTIHTPRRSPDRSPLSKSEFKPAYTRFAQTNSPSTLGDNRTFGQTQSPPVISTRPIKPVLFEPNLDHTTHARDRTDAGRGIVKTDVQYVLKSGSTREQARGKGKLWIG